MRIDEKLALGNLVDDLRDTAEGTTSLALDILLTTAAASIEGLCQELDTADETIDRQTASLDEMQGILQQIWDQDGFVDEDLKGVIRLLVRV